MPGRQEVKQGGGTSRRRSKQENLLSRKQEWAGEEQARITLAFEHKDCRMGEESQIVSVAND